MRELVGSERSTLFLINAQEKVLWSPFGGGDIVIPFNDDHHLGRVGMTNTPLNVVEALAGNNIYT